MKNNLDYYRHFVTSHNHWKFKLLRKEYKWEGEGKFWALNNEIAASDNCILDLSDEGKKMSIAIDLDFDIDSFNAYLMFLSTKCKLITMDGDKITTKITQETLVELAQERERKRAWIKQKREQEKASSEGQGSSTGQSVDVDKQNVDVDNQQSRVEYSTVDNSINNGAGAPPPKKLKKVFVKPTVEEVTAYILSKTNNHHNSRAVAENFMNFYQSNGWKVGKAPMSDWQAALRNCLLWEKNQVLLMAPAKKETQLTIVDMDEYLNRPKVNLPY